MSHFRRRAREGWRSRPHHVEQRTDEAFPIPWVGVPIVPPSRGWNLVEPTDLMAASSAALPCARASAGAAVNTRNTPSAMRRFM